MRLITRTGRDGASNASPAANDSRIVRTIPPTVAINVSGRPWARTDRKVPMLSTAGSGRAELLGGQSGSGQVGLGDTERTRDLHPASVAVQGLQLGVERIPQVVIGLPEHEPA